ncbi:6-phosphogluconate dehydrogenase-like protein [Streptomyces sp. 1114.5]|nr:6-phosphogluconate dehydrogenase-like protein [Streptomyces sp. 1114.5]SOB86345.1 NAD binding domain of 6-phosphogluconate dehydrogenase [Streptomyces sp. 1331.2]
MSSIGPRAVAGLRAQRPYGVALVDAPVIGSAGPAATGDLMVPAGGKDADPDRAQPVLEQRGRVRRCGAAADRVRRCGGPGAGAAWKLVVVIGAIVASVTVAGEVLAMAGELGALQEPAREVRPADAPIAEQDLPAVAGCLPGNR